MIKKAKRPEWGGVRGEGQHDLAIFTDALYYLEAQMPFNAQALRAAHQDDLADTGAPANANQSLPNLSEKEDRRVSGGDWGGACGVVSGRMAEGRMVEKSNVCCSMREF